MRAEYEVKRLENGRESIVHRVCDMDETLFRLRLEYGSTIWSEDIANVRLNTVSGA